MSQDYYIGPFGRILPLPDGKEPERQQFPIDETRTNMTTYQLPPPDQLHFGSDTSPGFTEPTRYLSNMLTQPSQSQQSDTPLYSENFRQNRHGQLPSLQSLLSPAQHPSSPSSPRPTQPNQNRQQQQEHNRQPTAPSLENKSLHPIQTNSQPQSAYQPSYSPSLPPQVQQSTNASPQQPPHRTGSFAQLYQPFYSQQQDPSTPLYLSPQTSHQGSYQAQPPAQPVAQVDHTQIQYTSPVEPQQFQQILPVNLIQPQHMPASDASPQSYPPRQSIYQATNSEMTTEQTSSATANLVKSQPRVVGERDIPGEGPSWVYEDGTTCKKVIDGEMVNAQWGITKAGKPRKRLAIACTTCREKKIKCDPAEPKCVQCEKFGRECRFTTAFRNQRGSPESPSYDFQARNPVMKIKSETPPYPSNISSILNSPDAEDVKVVKKRVSSPNSTYDTSAHSHENENLASKPISAKRQRVSLPGPISPKADRKFRTMKASRTAPESRPDIPSWDDSSVKATNVTYHWHLDPYVIDRELTVQFVENYFTYVNNTTYRMFPPQLFLRWVQHSHKKSAVERMALYAMLAVGSVFSDDIKHHKQGSLLATIAQDAAEKSQGEFTLQLVHSRLLLSLYFIALGEPRKAWDFAGAAIRAASGLGFHLESDCLLEIESEENSYGLSKFAIAECRRRCFWTVFMIDIFGGSLQGHPRMLQMGDIFLRLPVKDAVYEAQQHSEVAYFDNGFLSDSLCKVKAPSELSTMAFAVQITSIWSDIFTNVFRSCHQSQDSYQASAEQFYAECNHRLSIWLDSLPANIKNNASGLDQCFSNSKLGSFVSLHSIYHAAFVRMNRSVRCSILPASTFTRSVKEAIDHAQRLLEMIKTVSDIIHQSKGPQLNGYEHHHVEFPLSSAMAGYAVLSAVDVVSAGGRLDTSADTISLIDAGLAVFERLGRYWASSRMQCKAIKGRRDRLKQCLDSNVTESKMAWKCKASLDTSYPKGQDVCYCADDIHGEAFLRCLGVDVTREEILLIE